MNPAQAYRARINLPESKTSRRFCKHRDPVRQVAPLVCVLDVAEFRFIFLPFLAADVVPDDPFPEARVGAYPIP